MLATRVQASVSAYRCSSSGDRQPLAHLSGRGTRLALHGEIADHLADDVFTALFDLACAAPGEVEVDLSDLSFLDRAGARVLARTERLLREVGVQLLLVDPQPLVARALHLSELRTLERAETAH